jgi:hypothetical protein
MTKIKNTAKDARGTVISLAPEEELALNTIILRRRKRREKRDNRNAVVADAVWYYLTKVEKVPRQKIEELVPTPPEEEKPSNITPIRKNGDKIET